MKVICFLVKDGRCGSVSRDKKYNYEFLAPKTCEHQFPHEKGYSCIKGYCSVFNGEIPACVEYNQYNIELPEEIFD